MKTAIKTWAVAWMAAGVLGAPAPALQAQGSAGSAPAAPAPAPDKAPLKQEELDQLLAPVALYPDSVVSQMLMASTYPLEIVEAARWAKSNSSLKGDALAKALEGQKWDPSVKSLVNLPQVLTMMNDKLDWTVKLGDAFIGQQKEVMDTVQKLRAKAQAQGNLKSTEQQKVIVEKEQTTQIIKIESTSPDVIYVPSYDPVVVYGAWPYPAYPPVSYYPPGYVAGTAALSFGVGVACGLAWGYAWGGCDWHHGDVDIDTNRNVNRNTNINRTNVQQNIQNKTWQHDPSHRQGVAYRDQATSQRFGKGGSADAAKAREQFRGRAEAGRQDLAKGNLGSGDRAGVSDNRAGDRGGRDGDRGSAGGDREGISGDRGGGGSGRDNSKVGGGGSGGAFSGADRGGSEARTNSNRGSASRGTSSSGGSSASRSSGGGSRGGGGRGGGRR